MLFINGLMPVVPQCINQIKFYLPKILYALERKNNIIFLDSN